MTKNSSPLTIEAGDIDLWIVQPESICDKELLTLYKKILTPDEEDRRKRFHFKKDRYYDLVTRVFVRSLLSQYVNIPPQNLKIIRDERNKPEFIDSPLPLRFNISHTAGCIVCAVNLFNDIGVDVENIAREVDSFSIASHYYSSDENRLLDVLPLEKRSVKFFEIWTLKESYVKACGAGLTIPPNHISCKIYDYNDIHVYYSESSNSWRHYLKKITPNHLFAITVRIDQQRTHRFRYFQSIPMFDYWETELPLF